MNKAASALAKRRWAKRDVEKTCPFCGRRFKGDGKQVYCTPAHQNAAAARRFRERRQSDSTAGPRRPATAARAPAEGLAHALEQAERARAADDLDGAARWEQIAARIAADVAESGSE